jgi:proline utilization trans-activator
MLMANNLSLTGFLGTSSNWSFASRVLSIANECGTEAPFSADLLLYDGKAYQSEWDKLRIATESNKLALPSRDYSLYLINAVNFHLTRLFHLFDEDYFLANFNRFHESPSKTGDGAGLWYVHYLLILAFGKAFVVHKTKATTPPGADLFIHAMKRLPDMTSLCGDPIIATEILCCITLYLQALDFRSSAYNFVSLVGR